MTHTAYLTATAESLPVSGKLSWIFNRKVADVLTGAAVSASVSTAVKLGIFAAVGTTAAPLAVTVVGAAVAAGMVSGAARHALAWRAMRRDGNDAPAFWSRENGMKALRGALLSGVFAGAGGGLFMALDHFYGDRLAEAGGKAVSWLRDHVTFVSAAYAESMPVIAVAEAQAAMPATMPATVPEIVPEAAPAATVVADYTAVPVTEAPQGSAFVMQENARTDFVLPPDVRTQTLGTAFAPLSAASEVTPLQFVTYTDDLYTLVTTEDMLKAQVAEAVDGRNLSRGTQKLVDTAFGAADAPRAVAQKAQAMKDVAFMMLNGRGGMAEDSMLGVALMRMAAAAGNDQARVDMAYIAYHGLHGVVAAPEEALNAMRDMTADSAEARRFVAAWTGQAPAGAKAAARAVAGALSCQWNIDAGGNLAGGVCRGPGAALLKAGDKVAVPILSWR